MAELKPTTAGRLPAGTTGDETMNNKAAWVVMSIPGNGDSDPGSWFAYNRNTLEQVRCENREEASRIVAELRN
jgi:hypothetical protein